jgi:hypothetical protein
MSDASRPDLPLFSWKPQTHIFVFPFTRRIAKIRHTAGKVATKRGENLDLYWKQVISGLDKSLVRIGIDADGRQREIDGFVEAVRAEVIRQSYDTRARR